MNLLGYLLPPLHQLRRLSDSIYALLTYSLVLVIELVDGVVELEEGRGKRVVTGFIPVRVK